MGFASQAIDLLIALSSGRRQCSREPTHIIVVIWVIFFQTELVAENYSKSPVRAIGKVLLMKFT